MCPLPKPKLSPPNRKTVFLHHHGMHMVSHGLLLPFLIFRSEGEGQHALRISVQKQLSRNLAGLTATKCPSTALFEESNFCQRPCREA